MLTTLTFSSWSKYTAFESITKCQIANINPRVSKDLLLAVPIPKLLEHDA